MPVEMIHVCIALMFSTIWLMVIQLVVSERRRASLSGRSVFPSDPK